MVVFVMGERAADLARNTGDQAQGDGKQDKGRNPFGGLIDVTKDIYRKAEKEVRNIDTDKIGDAVGTAGRQIGQQADKIGAGDIGQQARDISGSAQRTIKGEGTQADRERLIGAGVEAGKLMMGGGTLTVADQLMKHGVIPGGGKGGFNFGSLSSLGGIFKRGAQEITKVDTLGFVKSVRENWDRLDADNNGFITRTEAANAAGDKLFAIKNAHMLSVLDSMHDTISGCQNDELGSEDDGVTKGDILAIEKGKIEGTGFSGIGSFGKGAWDAKYATAATAGGTAYLSRAGSTGSMLTKGGIAAAAVLAVGGVYGTIDYYTSRKGNIEKVISELK